MKKSLVLAMAMALGVTASAYAANPFSDVPAGHWAYDSIAKLAAAGVVDGYPDGAFKGENLMTRYEMAQIVAKAMAKGANVEALAAEFADELDNLGVRVAALEKKVDNTKITGAIRYDYTSYQGDLKATKGHRSRLRSDITLAGQVNEDWKYTAMWRYDAMLDNYRDEGNGSNVNFQRAYLDGRLFGLKVRAGRATFNDGSMAQFNGGNIYDDRADLVSATYGKDINLTLYAGRGAQSGAGWAWDDDKKAMKETKAFTGNFWGANLGAKFSKATEARLAYFRFSDPDESVFYGTDNDALTIWTVGVKGTVAKQLVLAADYYKSNANDQNKGWALGAQWGKATPAKVGSWDLFVKYLKMDANSYIANGQLESVMSKNEGIKGWNIGADYTIAKNIMAKVLYNNTKSTVGDKDQRCLWTSLHFNF